MNDENPLKASRPIEERKLEVELEPLPVLVFHVPDLGTRVFAGFGEAGPTTVVVDEELREALSAMGAAVASVLVASKLRQERKASSS